jgi:hypothetical protein
LAGALDDDDFDLAGELLLAWPFLDAAWDEPSSFAFAVLAGVEDEVGVPPSLALDRAEYERQPVAARKSYVAAVAYNTAYVMGLLCAVMLSRNSLAAVIPFCAFAAYSGKSKPNASDFRNHDSSVRVAGGGVSRGATTRWASASTRASSRAVCTHWGANH